MQGSLTAFSLWMALHGLVLFLAFLRFIVPYEYSYNGRSQCIVLHGSAFSVALDLMLCNPIHSPHSLHGNADLRLPHTSGYLNVSG